MTDINSNNKKALIAMSGGVDSSVCAVILKEQGYDVSGVTLKLFDNEDGTYIHFVKKVEDE